MDCSMREAARKEQSIAPQNAFFWTHRDHKKGQNSLPKSFFGVSETACFFVSQRMLFSVFFLSPCISGIFCCFIPCNLSRLSQLPPKMHVFGAKKHMVVLANYLNFSGSEAVPRTPWPTGQTSVFPRYSPYSPFCL